jgi:cytochrome P450
MPARWTARNRVVDGDPLPTREIGLSWSRAFRTREGEATLQPITSFEPFDPAVLADPQPWYRWLRTEQPVYQVPSSGAWVLSRWTDVQGKLRDHGALTSTRGVAPEPGAAIGLIGTDPPAHERLRRVVQGVFTPRIIERSWGDRIAVICDALVDDAIAAGAAGSIDGVAALAMPLPMQVIAEILGVPDGDFATFKRWSDAMIAGVGQHLDDAVKQQTQEAFAGLGAYFGERIAERRTRPGHDLITLLCQAGDDERLTPRELVHFCILLLIADNETTTNLLGNGLLALLDHPDQETALRADPGLLPTAIEEMLRYCPSTHAVFRQTTRPIELHGRTIPADQRVMLCLAAANRDETRFHEPDRFWITRPALDHLAFGNGIHFCLGATLARLEMRTMLSMLLARTSRWELAGAPRITATPVVRGPTYLPLALTPRQRA